jgi:hypothetical protein
MNGTAWWNVLGQLSGMLIEKRMRWMAPAHGI